MPAVPTLQPPCPTAVLRHDLPDGSHHFDWLIAPAEEGPLLTFRLERPLDSLAPGASLPMQRLADHRRLYLTHEGPIAGDRGSVQRVARGEVAACETVEGCLILLLQWAHRSEAQRVRLEQLGADKWLAFSFASSPSIR